LNKNIQGDIKSNKRKNKREYLRIFFHPDYTVGFGIEPNQPRGSWALPPVGNLTLP
jgi:hypothetical protein